MKIVRITCGRLKPARLVPSGNVHPPGRLSTATVICGPPYEGETEVTPRTVQQTLPTKDHLVKVDITVKAIPYFETTNLSGGYTAIIGG